MVAREIEERLDPLAIEETQETDEFGGVIVNPELYQETDEFGGVAVQEQKPEDIGEQIVETYVRPTLQGLGTVGGILVGGTTGLAGGPAAPATVPLGMIAGGGLGYAIADEFVDLFKQFLGMEDPQPMLLELQEAAENVAEGLTYEMGGQAVVPAAKLAGRGVMAIPGVGSALRKTGEGIATMAGRTKDLFRSMPLSAKGTERKAGEVLSAMTSKGPLIVENMEQARALEEAIPGLKFELAQLTGDPGVIKYAKGSTVAPGDFAVLQAERVAANTKAINDYINQVKGVGSVEDALQKLGGRERTITRAVEKTGKALAKETSKLKSSKGPIAIGETISEELKAGEKAARKKAKQLFKAVPEQEQIVDDIYDEFKKIMKPKYRSEGSDKFPKVLQREIQAIEQDMKIAATTKPIGKVKSIPLEHGDATAFKTIIDDWPPSASSEGTPARRVQAFFPEHNKWLDVSGRIPVKEAEKRLKDFNAVLSGKLKKLPERIPPGVKKLQDMFYEGPEAREIANKKYRKSVPEISGEPKMSLEDIQGLRSEILEDLRTAREKGLPRSLQARLARAVDFIDKKLGATGEKVAKKIHMHEAIPDIVYRGYAKGREFRGKGRPIHFSSSKKIALTYPSKDLLQGKEHIISAYKVNIKNPKIYKGQLEKPKITFATGAKEVKNLKAKGYDGAIWIDEAGNTKEIVAFDKSQIAKEIPTKAQFEKEYFQHTDLRSKDLKTAKATAKKIKEEGFKSNYLNTVPPTTGKPTTVIDKKFGTKKGKLVYLVPKNAVDKTGKIKQGWKPKDENIIEIDYDGQSAYEKFIEKLGVKKAITPSKQLQAAQKFFREEVIEKYHTGASRAAFRESVQDVAIAQKYFKSGPTGAQSAKEFMQALGKNKKAVSAMKKHINQNLYDAVISPKTGEISAPSLSRWLKTNKYALKEMGLEKEFDTLKKARTAADRALTVSKEFEKTAASTMLKSDVNTAVRNAFAKGARKTAAEELMKQLETTKRLPSRDELLYHATSETLPSGTALKSGYFGGKYHLENEMLEGYGANLYAIKPPKGTKILKITPNYPSKKISEDAWKFMKDFMASKPPKDNLEEMWIADFDELVKRINIRDPEVPYDFASFFTDVRTIPKKLEIAKKLGYDIIQWEEEFLVPESLIKKSKAFDALTHKPITGGQKPVKTADLYHIKGKVSVPDKKGKWHETKWDEWDDWVIKDAPKRTIKNLKNKAIKGLQNAFVDEILIEIPLGESNEAVKLLSSKKVANNLRKYDSALKIIFKDSPEKLKAMFNVRRAIKTLEGGKTVPGGGIERVENLLTYMARRHGFHRRALVNIVATAVGPLKRFSAKQVNGLLNRALLDPDFAFSLIETVRKGKPAKPINLLVQSLVRLGLIMPEEKEKK